MLRRHRRRSFDTENRTVVASDVLRQIGRCDPCVAAIVGPEQSIAAEIHRSWIVRRENERRVPVETVERAGRRGRNDVRILIASDAELRGSLSRGIGR